MILLHRSLSQTATYLLGKLWIYWSLLFTILMHSPEWVRDGNQEEITLLGYKRGLRLVSFECQFSIDVCTRQPHIFLANCLFICLSCLRFSCTSLLRMLVFHRCLSQTATQFLGKLWIYFIISMNCPEWIRDGT